MTLLFTMAAFGTDHIQAKKLVLRDSKKGVCTSGGAQTIDHVQRKRNDTGVVHAVCSDLC